jgi:hypothetical protein
MTDLSKVYTVKLFLLSSHSSFLLSNLKLLYFGNSGFTLKRLFLSNGKKRMFLRFKKTCVIKDSLLKIQSISVLPFAFRYEFVILKCLLRNHFLICTHDGVPTLKLNVCFVYFKSFLCAKLPHSKKTQPSLPSEIF